MATLTRTITESFGSATLYIYIFSDLNDEDTLATGLGSTIIGAWANGTDAPTQEKEGIGVANSSGTLTFHTGEDSRAAQVFVLAKPEFS